MKKDGENEEEERMEVRGERKREALTLVVLKAASTTLQTHCLEKFASRSDASCVALWKNRQIRALAHKQNRRYLQAAHLSTPQDRGLEKKPKEIGHRTLLCLITNFISISTISTFAFSASS